MGNQACCDTRNTEYKETFPEVKVELSTNKKEEQGQPYEGQVQPKEQEQAGAQLSPQARARLEHYQEQEDEKIGSNPEKRRFGRQNYYGSVDEDNHPHGHGKIIKTDGSVYMGQWDKGKAQGHGVYIMKDGSFYEGAFFDNKAEGHGKYFSGGFNYEGFFQNNQFHGMGTEKSESHSFHGDFNEGRKVHGIFTWNDNEGKQCEYAGDFNDRNEFEGKGKLKESKGVYDGDFYRGEKHGKGTYKFDNGLRYEGQYSEGRKKGQGIIFNSNGSIAYEGEFNNDVPDGQGYVYDKEGNRMERTWVKGIDSSALA